MSNQRAATGLASWAPDSGKPTCQMGALKGDNHNADSVEHFSCLLEDHAQIGGP